VHGVDLEVAPVERAVGIVVVNLAGAFGVLRALDRERYAACAAELAAGVLLVCGEPASACNGLSPSA
jgi:hypothetical protein